MHELAPLIIDLTTMLGVAGLVVLIFQRIHQPVVLGYLVAGMITGPYLTPRGLVTDTANIKILSELGVIFLMFSLGLEFSFHKLTKVGVSALITGLIDVSFMVALGFSLGLMFGWHYNQCLFLGAAMAISSTTIIFKAVNELGLKTKRFAEVIFGVLIVEDLLAILLLVALSTIIATRNFFSIDILFAAVKLVLVVGGWFLIGYFVVPSLFRKVAHYISQETLTIVSVALCLLLVSIAAYFNYSTALGAFIMGSILAETILVHRIEESIVPIRDIFGAVFFISVGMLIDPAVIVHQWQTVVIIALALMLGKVFIISVGTFLTGQSIKTAVRAGFGMAQIGEFSFIIATLGLALHAIDEKFYPIIVAVSGITTFTTPYMMRLSAHIAKQIEKILPDRIKHFMDSYSAWVYRTQMSMDGNPFARTVTMRILANGIMVAIIFTLINTFMYPEVVKLASSMHQAKMMSEVAAILLSSPFIWGMLFSYKRVQLLEYAKSPLNPVMFLVWLLTLAEVGFLSMVYFHTWLTVAIFMVLVAVFFAVGYRYLEKSYHWFETQLVGNIGPKAKKKMKYRELSPWDTHFVDMIVSINSTLNNKTLRECEIRQRYGINVVAIRRGQHMILAPRGEEVIHDGDKLVLLGNDDQIDQLKQLISPIDAEEKLTELREQVVLKPVLLGKNHSLVGCTIRDSMIREKFNGLVVGLERNNQRILNPNSETVLEEDDLLLIVGEIDKINSMEVANG